MPRLTVWMIRFALAYLLVGFTIGAALLILKGLAGSPAPMPGWVLSLWRWLPAHIEFLLIVGPCSWLWGWPTGFCRVSAGSPGAGM
jgi:hypothetical protein